MKDEYGITGITKPSKEFFADLLKPVDQKLVEKCKNIFEGIENITIENITIEKKGKMKTFKQFIIEDKEYTAFVRDRDTGNATKITRSYPSMKKFKQDLRSNGYRIMSVAAADEVGSTEWERKLADQREKRKERKSNRLTNLVNKNDYVRKKTEPLWNRWMQLQQEKDKYEIGSEESRRLTAEALKVYDEYKAAQAKAEAEFDSMSKNN